MENTRSTITTIAVIAGAVHASCWSGLGGAMILWLWGISIHRRIPIALVIGLSMTAGARVFLDNRLAQ